MHWFCSGCFIGWVQFWEMCKYFLFSSLKGFLWKEAQSVASFNFFCFLNLKELEFESEEKKSLEDRTENLPSAPSHLIPSATSVKHPNCRWRNQSVTEMGPDPEQDFKVPLQSWRKEEQCIWDKNEKRDIAEEAHVKDFCGEEDPARSHVFALCSLLKDAAWYKKMFYPHCEASINPSPEGRLENSDIVRNLLEKHQGDIPFHSPCFYAARAKCVKSIPGYRELAFPDFWGHQPPPYSKPVLERKHGVQRWLCFNGVTTLRALGLKTGLRRFWL